MKKIIPMAFAFAALLISGCASKENRHPQDPFEPVNRAIFSFNDGADRIVLKPVAKGYKKVMPNIAQTGVRNFFDNLNGVWSTANAGLQLKGEKVLTGVFRVGVNTIFGFGGLFDVATEMGLDDPQEDLGQTLGFWGVGSGPYLVLPLLGPTNARDTVGAVGRAYADPMLFFDEDEITYSSVVLRTISLRASLLDAESAIEHSVLDRYIFFRDASIQRRESLVHDGNPPLNTDEFEFDDDEL